MKFLHIGITVTIFSFVSFRLKLPNKIYDLIDVLNHECCLRGTCLIKSILLLKKIVLEFVVCSCFINFYMKKISKVFFQLTRKMSNKMVTEERECLIQRSLRIFLSYRCSNSQEDVDILSTNQKKGNSGHVTRLDQ